MNPWTIIVVISVPYLGGLLTGLLVAYDRGKSNGYKDAIRRLGNAQRAGNRYE
jgi:hypothetical protein